MKMYVRTVYTLRGIVNDDCVCHVSPIPVLDNFRAQCTWYLQIGAVRSWPRQKKNDAAGCIPAACAANNN